MMKILIPVDFSAASRQAMRYGYYLGEHADVQLILLHVFDVPLMVTEGYVFTPSAEEISEIKTNHLTHLHQFVKGDAKLNINKVETKFESIYGNPPDQIIQYAQKEKVDLIIMGIQGRCVRPSYFMGSTVIQIINNTSIPVMALHGCTQFSDLKHILFTYDLKTFNNKSIFETITRLAKYFRAHIYVLNICEKVPDYPMLEEKLLTNERASDLLRNEISFHVIQNENVIVGIKEFLKTHPVDLICYVPREHNMLSKILKDSVTRRSAFEINLPFLAIHN